MKGLFTVTDAVVTADGPLVVAVVVNGSVAVEEQPVGARLQRQRPVGALVVLVAVARVRVQLQTFVLWAHANILEDGRLLHHRFTCKMTLRLLNVI